MTFIKFYFIGLIIFFTIDLFWLAFVGKNIFKEELGSLMSNQVRWGPALLFYGLYIAGLVFFAFMPAFQEENFLSAILYGGFFGLVCYATYDLTNLATLQNWSTKLVIYDLLWGTFLSALTCYLTFIIGNHWKM